MNTVQLEEMMGGALQEQFGKSFERILENLADPNTPFKDARKITITMKFNQNEKRDDVKCVISVTEKLAAQAPMCATFAVGKDLKTGKVHAEEYGKNIKGQVSFDDNMRVDPETGEVLEDQPQNTVAVLDLRRAASN